MVFDAIGAYVGTMDRIEKSSKENCPNCDNLIISGSKLIQMGGASKKTFKCPDNLENKASNDEDLKKGIIDNFGLEWDNGQFVCDDCQEEVIEFSSTWKIK